MKAAIPPDIIAGIERESLGIEVTTHCNASCPYCFVRTGAGKPSNLAFEAVQCMLAEGFRLGYRNLHLSGGEPLLWDGLLPILRYAATCGYETVLINSNGILLTPEVSRRLAEFDNIMVSVSLQGPKAFHCRVRGGDHYDSIRAHIAAALEAGLKVSLFTTVFRSLLPVIPAFAQDSFAAYPGIDCLAFIQLIRVPGDAVDLSRELLSPEAFLSLVQMVALLRLYGLQVDILNNPLAGAAAEVLGLPWQPWSHPLTAPGRLMIRANGAITASHSGRRRFGRYKAGQLGDILASRQYAAAVAADGTICPDCRFVGLCRRNGMRRPSAFFRDAPGREPSFCQRVLARAHHQAGTVTEECTTLCI